MTRENFASQSPYEPIMAFSRAVRAGNMVFVSGTVGWKPDGTLGGIGDMYEQTRLCIANIGAILERAGASLKDVVRTRVYVTNADRWEEVAKAHREAFEGILPAATLVEVSRLATPEMLVEVEADAYVG